ncbi:unnamed protein product [Victoria cruziana]
MPDPHDDEIKRRNYCKCNRRGMRQQSWRLWSIGAWTVLRKSLQQKPMWMLGWSLCGEVTELIPVGSKFIGNRTLA